MKLLRSTTLAALALAFSATGYSDAHAAGDSPNLLLVTIDTARTDRLGIYGYEAARTPVLDSLAKRGALLEEAYSPAPMTLPVHTSLMTGLLLGDKQGLLPPTPTFAMKNPTALLLITLALLAGAAGALLVVGNGARPGEILELGPARAHVSNATASQGLGALLVAALPALPETAPRRSLVDGVVPPQAVRENRSELSGVVRAFGTAKLARDWGAKHHLEKDEMRSLDHILEEDFSTRVSIASERKELPTPKDPDFTGADIPRLRDEHGRLDEARRQVIEQRDADLKYLLGEQRFEDFNRQVGSRIGH